MYLSYKFSNLVVIARPTARTWAESGTGVYPGSDVMPTRMRIKGILLLGCFSLLTSATTEIAIEPTINHPERSEENINMRFSKILNITIEDHEQGTAQKIMEAMKPVDEPSKTVFESHEATIIVDPEELNQPRNRIEELEALQQTLIDEKGTLQAEKLALGVAGLAALGKAESCENGEASLFSSPGYHIYHAVWVVLVSCSCVSASFVRVDSRLLLIIYDLFLLTP